MENIDFDKLVEMVDDFLAPFGLDSDYDADFSYDIEEERVYFSILVAERSDRLFKEYIKKTFNFDVPSIFMISLLHEVGHAETIKDITFKQFKKDLKAKNLLIERLEAISKDDPTYDAIFSEYFDLGVEKVATQWAVNYYKENKKRCDDFYFIFEDALKAEYKRINLK